jgi:hypothetical protein
MENLPAESSGSKLEERAKGMMNLALRSTFVHTRQVILLHVAKSYEVGLRLSKEGVSRIFITLKSPSSWLGFNL